MNLTDLLVPTYRNMLRTLKGLQPSAVRSAPRVEFTQRFRCFSRPANPLRRLELSRYVRD
jgi:hypothetical protein